MFQNLYSSGSDSEEEEYRRFFTVCAENKVNALIARMREYEQNYDRPEEFENEAVSMAIQQHGLKNCEGDCCTERNENRCNQNTLEDSSEATTSKTSSPKICQERSDDGDVYPRSKQRKQCSNSGVQKKSYNQGPNSDDYDIDDDDFLSEAVAVAIKKKGLMSCCKASD